MTEKKTTRKKRRVYSTDLLLPEVRASLKVRLNAALEVYGTKANLARAAGVSAVSVHEWFKKGMVSIDGASALHRRYKKDGLVGYRASFYRPDIDFDTNGNPKSRRCWKSSMLKRSYDDK